MTAPLPPDLTTIVAALMTPLPDPAHDLIRTRFLAVIQVVWSNHQQLVDALTASKNDLTATQQALAALTDRVAALETPTPTP